MLYVDLEVAKPADVVGDNWCRGVYAGKGQRASTSQVCDAELKQSIRESAGHQATARIDVQGDDRS